jgi:predicted dehydrogenase
VIDHTRSLARAIWPHLGHKTRSFSCIFRESGDTRATESAGLMRFAGMYRLMAHDLRHGTRTAKSFDDAVALHRTISAIEESAETGKRVRVGG